MTVIVLGIDPGAVATGWALMRLDRGRSPVFLDAATTARSKPADYRPTQHLPVEADYLKKLAATGALVARTAREAATANGRPVAPIVVGIEGITRPNWHMNGRAAANPEALIAAAIVLGNIQAWATTQFGPYTEIPPGGNGSAPLGTYPTQLVSDAERRKANWHAAIGASGKLRHQRSAWDVALTAARTNLNTHTSNTKRSTT
ncbi:hypothetical protein [Rhodococcoides kyotonense]|uniref:Uncharacterized protein n=1 Tax=Rhodococcoides kyotonense TaxID=398843 RepID=A0A239FQ06_9NOCA|nr:hypothetical protein [Rhodococcus kyotonensis]SNS59126.1 hypothetical protein SAMN05421642_103410 [Rhodococcus kyotonensis]